MQYAQNVQGPVRICSTQAVVFRLQSFSHQAPRARWRVMAPSFRLGPACQKHLAIEAEMSQTL